MSSIKRGDGIRPRSRFGKPETREGMRYGTLRESARKRGGRNGETRALRESAGKRGAGAKHRTLSAREPERKSRASDAAQGENDEGVASREEEQDGVRRRRKRWNTQVLGRLIAKSGRVKTLREKASSTRVQSQSGAKNCLSYDESERRVYIGSSREREDKATIWSSTESKGTVQLRRIVSLAGDNPRGVVGNEVGEPVKMERVYGYGKREVGVGALCPLGVRSRKLKGSGKSEIQYKRKSV